MLLAQADARNQPTTLEHMAHLDIYSETQCHRMTGIICTIGPKTNSVDMLVQLAKAGMNVVRLNFSHGTYEFHQSIIDNTREACKQLDSAPLAIALDTKGPEIRMGQLVDDIEITLEKGTFVELTTDESRKANGDAHSFYVDYKNMPKVVTKGGLIYVDDGLISLEVVDVSDVSVKTKVVNSGKLGSRKGINLPNADVDLPALSEKDKQDLAFGVKNGVDIIFASFVRRAQDVLDIRAALGEAGKKIKIISKIENHQGMQNFDEILAVTDGIMVARGDLGIEIPAEKVFLAQKMMISRCNKAGKSVICATQMLESMTVNPRPTRAEVSDVANAVLDGSDCVMLSGETAKGLYPIEAVTIMHKICREAESAIYYRSLNSDLRYSIIKPLSPEEATASAGVNAAFESNVAAIIILSKTGNSARLVSKYKPPCPVICVTRDRQVARQLHLYRSLAPVHYQTPRDESQPWQADVENRITYAVKYAKSRGLIKSGDLVVVLQGWMGGVGHTNTIRLLNAQ